MHCLSVIKCRMNPWLKRWTNEKQSILLKSDWQELK